VGETIVLGASVAEVLLERYGFGWLRFAGPLINVLSYDALNACTTDPPTMVDLTPDEANALLSLQLGGDFASGLAKLGDIVLNLAWHEYCQCSSFGTPPLIAQPAPPGLTVALPTGECGTFTGELVAMQCASPNFVFYLLGEGHQNPSGSTRSNPASLWIPAGATSVRATVTLTDSLNALTGASIDWFNASNVNISNSGVGMCFPGSPQTLEMAIPAGAVRFGVQVGVQCSPPVLQHAFASVAFYCGGSNPSAPAGGCCPPDPLTAEMTRQTWELVRLIQRQLVPFAYLSSTEHASLTGNGSFAVQGLVGIRVELESWGDIVGEYSGDPDVLTGAGWFNWGNADGVSAREWISAEQQVSFPAAAGQYTAVHYSFGLGVTGRITELVREP
jgi:hypothetical protein